ncbi:putative reverse transcriptase zinc-binding domain-containing protein [Helianthus annuus]|uniref:Reverse transcriptase zinc-binding domain-containing protein n=1 Tax=Helianthus annuus TaxID=4232 RepID=A0A9K3I401_HELAN|nr:putative reverse transcriptase zinc-binding domain-containing protein [Helianthus annuus]KAJ0532692.1 putative reverse transcriptase zinc-binding domain-containing protein [Helianthus annuus]KAJ0541110.1 putative reverse transcriptase zinc-binding domain-containing protein [Helianthus annuus]KAJ0706194.1 putative reverse transcriptase zinc-binding domain-containing protein [Helianthus annuus]KAJ0710284.1 putative reverse transcriptase zinc-binding domain-containing protein [Helianthus annuus
MEQLMRLMDSFSISDKKDTWEWQGNETDGFSVKGIKRILQELRDVSSLYAMHWFRRVSIRCNLFTWRKEMDRILTADALIKRNIQVILDGCAFCDSLVEASGIILRIL